MTGEPAKPPEPYYQPYITGRRPRVNIPKDAPAPPPGRSPYEAPTYHLPDVDGTIKIDFSVNSPITFQTDKGPKTEERPITGLGIQYPKGTKVDYQRLTTDGSIKLKITTPDGKDHSDDPKYVAIALSDTRALLTQRDFLEKNKHRFPDGEGPEAIKSFLEQLKSQYPVEYNRPAPADGRIIEAKGPTPAATLRSKTAPAPTTP